MKNLSEAQAELARYETMLLAAAERALKNADEETEPPWVAVALGYHHGLSFGPLIGVLPQAEYEESKDDFDEPRDRFNPAEWAHWDDSITLEDEELLELGDELERLGESSLDGPRYGREIHVRVAKALRQALLDAELLTDDGLVYATEYNQSDWEENVRASNPAEACAAHEI